MKYKNTTNHYKTTFTSFNDSEIKFALKNI